MGSLHKGHLALINKSKETCDITIVSIFVNPIQFTPYEDLNKYPRNLKNDKKILMKENVDYLFTPQSEQIYQKHFQTYVNVEDISKKLEGASRPAHFKGVTTIVNILFNCINPHYAFFGQKDAQQASVIKQMVTDLKLNINITVCPIVRELDGLAMSSRNVFLSKEERDEALVLYKSLQMAKKIINAGERNVNAIRSKLKSMIKAVKSSNPDYVEIVKSDSFEFMDELEQGSEYYILIACKFGKTRLIDNELIKII
ncbi:MAG: pantoate--beta-alanine ligase [Ignavibacteria bacterium]|nr:MAG: pantoate--beta-alanine ligase [Ignavibacteria bacterium]